MTNVDYYINNDPVLEKEGAGHWRTPLQAFEYVDPVEQEFIPKMEKLKYFLKISNGVILLKEKDKGVDIGLWVSNSNPAHIDVFKIQNLDDFDIADKIVLIPKYRAAMTIRYKKSVI